MSSAIKHQNGGLLMAIARVNYAATGDQVEQLAYAVATGVDAGTVYLRVVLAHMQARLGSGRRRAAANMPQEPVLDAIHEDLYPHVLKGVGPEDMDRDERNSKANFARTMASTVRYFIQHGGDVRAVDIPTVTKNGLRKSVQPKGAEAPAGASRALRGFLTASGGLKRAIARLARGDPGEARKQVEQLLDEYEALLEELAQPPEAPAAAPPPADVGGQTTTIVSGRAGTGRSTGGQAPMLHRGA